MWHKFMNKNSKKWTASIHLYNPQKEGLGSYDVNYINAYRKDKDSKWEYEAKGTNLLNIGSQVRNSANNISVFNASTFIQPRFITLRAVYKL